MKIVKQRSYYSGVTYEKAFGIKPSDMHYSFKCDETGAVDLAGLPLEAVENYQACENGAKKFQGKTIEFLKIRRIEFEGYEPAIGLCDVCEAKVELSCSMTNRCDCGAEYNGSGQRLEDRRLWDGSDGETSADCE